MNKLIITTSVFFLLNIVFINCKRPTKKDVITNPISDGYYADPSIIKHEGKYFIYATIDPWGGEELAVLESDNFKDWERRHLNWPTKEACTSPTSLDAMVWAPSVIKGKDGKFYMYVSVGSEIWAGISDDPLGPWRNAKADSMPLISSELFPEYHMIDAQCFIDTDGQVYLYWGSGWDWVNGRCFVVKLKDDMITFDGEIKDVTPPNFFEAPFMIKRNAKYYLMYSDGKVIDHTYKIRYAIGDSPYGPWEEGLNSPILKTTADSSTFAPGHHSVFRVNEQDYILYHRRSMEALNVSEDINRELCIDSLNFDDNGNIKKVNPTGVEVFNE